MLLHKRLVRFRRIRITRLLPVALLIKLPDASLCLGGEFAARILLQKLLDAAAAVFGRAGESVSLHAGAQCGFECHGVNLVQQAFGQRKRGSRAGGKLGGVGFDLAIETGVGKNAVDHADFEGRAGGEGLAAGQKFEGALLGNRAAHDGHDHGGHETDFDFGITELCGLRRQDDVGGRRDAASAGESAAANGGDRAVGTPGYDSSIDYITNVLRDKGFDVQTPNFDFRQFEAGAVSLAVNGATVPAHVLQYSAGTGPDGGVARGGRKIASPRVAVPPSWPALRWQFLCCRRCAKT